MTQHIKTEHNDDGTESRYHRLEFVCTPAYKACCVSPLPPYEELCSYGDTLAEAMQRVKLHIAAEAHSRGLDISPWNMSE